MRVRWLIFTVYSLLSLTSPAQTIDELRTDRQVLAFLNKLYSEMGPFHIGLPKQTKWDKDLVSSAIQFGRPTFEKADLDRNGHTDLLFNGYGMLNTQTSIVVLSCGKDSFLVKWIPNNHADVFATHMVRDNNESYISILGLRYEYDQQQNTLYLIEKTDTLMYALGDFIEKATPEDYAIQQIKYRAMGSGSMFFPFSLTITDDSITYSRPKFYVLDNITDSGGTFIARLDPTIRSRIIGLLQHMNFPDLKDNYEPLATCNPFGKLHITYNNGKTKTISDTGLSGTYGLRLLHSLLWDLGSTQQWTLLKPEDESSFYSFGENW
jgi:hypothetical protein